MTEPDREEGALPRPASRRWRGIAAAASVAVFGIVLTTALHPPLGEPSRYVAVESDAPVAPQAPDPLMAALIRCRALPAQADDPACRAAWEENRRRFFGERRAMRVPGDPMPTYAAIPALAASNTAAER